MKKVFSDLEKAAMADQNPRDMDWLADRSINLSLICRRAAWHLATAIEQAQTAGLERRDAEAMIGFLFAEGDAHYEDYLTDEQYERLTQLDQ